MIEHPIKMYIRRDLGITVEQFGKLAGIPQSTLATWIKRERRVEKLPILQRFSYRSQTEN